MNAPASASAPSPLFGRARRLLGWQGYTVPLPVEWNPGKFSGKRGNGDLRVDDGDGTRFELRWEETTKTPDVEKSIANFLKQLGKDARKRGDEFRVDEKAHTVSKGRKRKEQITSFGWIGAPGAPASCGYGAAWSCPVCKRVTFAHILGHGLEKPDKIERLASEILGAMECHGEGGWDTWSAFDLQIEVPTEFELARAQLLLNKIEFEWVRPRPVGIYGLGRRAERIRMLRFPVANVLLEGKTLVEWADWNVQHKNKQLALREAVEDEFHGHEGLLYRGPARDLKTRAGVWLFDTLLRRRTPQGEVRVWNCPQSNRLYVLESEVSPVNAHVPGDVLDALVCH